MKTGFLFVLSVFAGALFIAATQIVGVSARSVSPADRLSIAEPEDSGQWKGYDLSVEYSYSKNQGQMDLSGNIRFASSLVLGYTRLEDFRLSAVLLDENGTVLKEIGLATNRDSFNPIPFHSSISLPSNAVSMAFSYQGKAIESGNEDGGGITSFWHYPVR